MDIVSQQPNNTSGKRRYHAPRRRAQADATRRAILAAAHDLFLADGYAATSIRAVAKAAEVSEQTVYNAFGDKPSLLVAVGDRVLSGELAPETLKHGDFRTQLLGKTDTRERIAFAAAWARMLWEQGMLRVEAMLLDAAATDPRAAEVAETIWRHKYDANKELFSLAFPAASRPAGDDPDEAYDVFFATQSAAFVRILIDDCGWSWDAYEKWTAAMLRRLFTTIPE